MFDREKDVSHPEEKKKSSQERRLERIQKLKNRIQRETNLLATQERKSRNSQLISWGIMVESAFRKGTAEQRQEFREMARTHVTDDRNLSRIFMGFDRLVQESEQSESVTAMCGEVR